MSPPAFIYLASASPRRSQLLDQIGVAHRPLLADETEDVEQLEEERRGELPADYVQRVTLAKLQPARRRRRLQHLPSAPILCADTTVAAGRRILGKPRSAEEAVATLRQLSGRTHRVLTAVAVGAGRQTFIEVSVSRVHVAELSERNIRRYVASGEPFGKAGAYAVQGYIAAWIERIEGSYTGIMGLPLFETARLLARARVSLEI